MKKRILFSCLISFSLTTVGGIQAGCLNDLGPYPDDYGWAVFPFQNVCEDAVRVNLCVKSWPSGSEEPAYNLYSGTVYGNDRLDLVDGRWELFDAYEWTEDGYQPCPW